MGIPQVQPQAGQHVGRAKGSLHRVLKFRDGRHRFREPIERDQRIKMVYVMVADIPGEPPHHRPQSHEARRLERAAIVGPILAGGDLHSRKIMLGEEEIGAERRSDREGKNEAENRSGESAERP